MHALLQSRQKGFRKIHSGRDSMLDLGEGGGGGAAGLDTNFCSHIYAVSLQKTIDHFSE